MTTRASSETLPTFYTKKDVADMLKVTTKTVDRAIRSGDLRAIKLKRAVRIQGDDLQTYLATRSDTWYQV
jgi:excisionase family DNA binding protein